LVIEKFGGISVASLERIGSVANIIESSHSSGEQMSASLLAMDRYKLQNRYDRHVEIHKDFEEHINNLSNFVAEERGKVVRLAFNFITYIAIPFGIFGALSRLDLDAVIYKTPEKILHSEPMWKVLLFSFLVPMVLFGLAYSMDRFWGKSQGLGYWNK